MRNFSVNMGKTAGGLTSLALLSAATFLTACSTDFQTCAEMRTCASDDGADTSAAGTGAGDDDPFADEVGTGSGGSSDDDESMDPDAPGAGGTAGTGAQGSSAGTGGMGGEGPGADCVSSDDCTDGLWCNGVEQCVDGKCEAGAEPCPNAYADQCEITCSEGISAASCDLQGRDADGDGHRDASCPQNSGDDCDDTVETGAAIHPGADELCNGLVDDDCDGADETTDQVLLAGPVTELVAAVGTSKRSEVTIEGTNGGFGVVWSDWRHETTGVTSEIYFMPVAADGTPGSEVRLTAGTPWSDNRLPDLITGDDANSTSWGIAYRATEAADGDQYVRFTSIKKSGTSQTAAVSLPGKNTITSGPKIGFDGDNWRAYWFDGSQLSRALVDAVSTTTSTMALESLAVLAGTSSSTPYFTRYDGTNGYYTDSLSGSLGSTSASDDATQIVASADAIAYHFDPASGPNVLQFKNSSCTFDLPEGYPVDMISGYNGWFILYWDVARTSLYVQELHYYMGCVAAGPSALVATEIGTGLEIDSASIAVDPGSTSADAVDAIAVVWSQKSDDEWTLQRRIFSNALCE
jgi:hypothetical protein